MVNIDLSILDGMKRVYRRLSSSPIILSENRKRIKTEHWRFADGFNGDHYCYMGVISNRASWYGSESNGSFYLIKDQPDNNIHIIVEQPYWVNDRLVNARSLMYYCRKREYRFDSVVRDPDENRIVGFSMLCYISHNDASEKGNHNFILAMDPANYRSDIDYYLAIKGSDEFQYPVLFNPFREDHEMFYDSQDELALLTSK